MTGLIRSEALKLRTARSTLGLTVGMVAMLTLVVAVHGFALPAERLTEDGQLYLFGLGGLGAVFAALLGALSITAELRTGMIRPTLLTTPRRGRVLVAKLVVDAAGGAGYGAVSALVAMALAALALTVRDIPIRLDGTDYARLVLGGVAAAALWAPLGLGVGALLRHQVGAVIGLCAWLLFVEPALMGQLPYVVRLFPGAAAAALTGTTISGNAPEDPGLLAAVPGGLLLLGYVVLAGVAGLLVTERRDVP